MPSENVHDNLAGDPGSREILRIIRETSRQNHSRASAARPPAPAGRPTPPPARPAGSGYQSLLPELEGRLARSIRGRVESALERLGRELTRSGSSHPTAIAAAPASATARAPAPAAGDLAATQEIRYQEPGSELRILSGQLDDLRSSLERTLLEATERWTAALGELASDRPGDGPTAGPESGLGAELGARLDHLEQCIAAPIVVATSEYDGAAPLSAEALELLQARIEERLDDLAASLGSELSQGMREALDGALGTALNGWLEGPGLEPLSRALARVHGSAESAPREDGHGDALDGDAAAVELLTALKRDFSHLVLTLNAHLEESRDRNRELQAQLEEISAPPQPPPSELVQILERLDHLDGRLAALPGMSSHEVLTELREAAQRLAARPDPAVIVDQLERDFGHLAETISRHLGETGRAPAAGASGAGDLVPDESVHVPDAAGGSNPILQLRRDFGLLVQTLNRHLQELRRNDGEISGEH